MKLKLSARDKDPMESKYDPEDFDAENKNKFQNRTNATNVALEMYYQGYKTLASISEQFKERNYKVDDETKKVIKDVIEKMEGMTETASFRSRILKRAGTAEPGTPEYNNTMVSNTLAYLKYQIKPELYEFLVEQKAIDLDRVIADLRAQKITAPFLK